MKRKLILAGLGLLSLFAFYWVYSHSFLEISAPDNANGQYSYRIANQKTNTVSEFKSDSAKIRKLVSKGDYEVSVERAGANYFTVVKSNGLLKTTKVTASLQPERERKFVGDNPGSCLNYVASMLVSYECGSYLSNINTHVPATTGLPTYTVKGLGVNPNGRVEGIVSMSGGSLVFYDLENPEDYIVGHWVSRLDNQFNPVPQSAKRLADLDPGKSYTITPHQNGFIAYDASYSQVFYYTSIESEPAKIALAQPKEKNVSPVSFSAAGDKYLSFYSTGGSDDKKSEAVITSGGASQNFVFDANYYSAKLCGTNKICLVGDTAMEIYGLDAKKPKLEARINGVTLVENSPSGLLVADKTGVLNFDVDSLAGHYEYLFGNYGFNGLQTVESGYILKLFTNKDRSVAVLVEQGAIDSDSIDKKIADLQKLQEVTFVSIYDKFIYISAKLGSPVYSSELRSYIDNPETKEVVAEKINKEIDKLGIDRKVYTITSNAF